MNLCVPPAVQVILMVIQSVHSYGHTECAYCTGCVSVKTFVLEHWSSLVTNLLVQ